MAQRVIPDLQFEVDSVGLYHLSTADSQNQLKLIGLELQSNTETHGLGAKNIKIPPHVETELFLFS